MSDSAPTPRRSHVAVRLLWIERFTRFATACLSLAAFCAAEDVPVTNFYYWKRQLGAPIAAPDTEPCFLPVRRALSVPLNSS